MSYIIIESLLNGISELEQHSKSYDLLLTAKISELIEIWCGTFISIDSRLDSDHSLCFTTMQTFIRSHVYELDANGCQYMESDDVLLKNLLSPLASSFMFQEVKSGRCERRVLTEIIVAISAEISTMFFNEIVKGKKPFTDWGSLVLAKQIRLFQNLLCTTIGDLHDAEDDNEFVNTAPILEKFEQMSQVCAILQLEKPSDWASHRYGDATGESLSPNQIRDVMYQRVDFSRVTVDKVCEKLGAKIMQ